MSVKIENLSHIEKLLDQLVQPQEKRQACCVADFHGGILTLGVKDSMWLTTLRFELPSWRDQLRQAGCPGLVSIQLKLMVDWPSQVRITSKRKNPPSAMAIESIQVLREWVKTTETTDVEENDK